MKVLIVGGTGLIGGHAALYLLSQGYEVTIAGRRPPLSVPSLSALPFVKGDYLNNDFTKDDLAAYEAIVFAAGSDQRHIPENVDADKHLLHANGVALPAFAELARAAGVTHFIHIGSAYPHILPIAVKENVYLQSRKLAAEAVANLSTDTFLACSLDPPIVVGTVPGLKVPHFEAYFRYAEGAFDIPEFAPCGGLNFISTQSLSEAIEGALKHGTAVAGRTILVGDENLTYQAFLEKFFHAVGNSDTKLQAKDDEHPLMPRATLFGGDKVISYEPDPSDVEMLGNYRRNDVSSAIEEIVRQYRDT